jgi:hypothetical protein
MLTGSGVALELYAEDMEVLRVAATQVAARL